MARTWLQIRVELVGGRDVVCDPPPGRDLLVGPRHTFAQLADAVNGAFGRWDLGHLHGFELADGRLIGFAAIMEDEPWLDHEAVKVAAEVGPGDGFTYTFDLGDQWLHRCTVQPEKADPREAYDDLPPLPVAVWGWGWIPDQYGRTSAAGED